MKGIETNMERSEGERKEFKEKIKSRVERFQARGKEIKGKETAENQCHKDVVLIEGHL